MILEGVIGLIVESLCIALSAFEVVGLPMQVVETLGTLACYGSYVVGTDIMLIFVANIASWASFKLTAGVLLFVWKLLPLT